MGGRTSAQLVAARRRTMVMAVLAGLTTVSLVAAVMGSVSFLLPVVSVLLLAGFVGATALTASQRGSAAPVTRREHSAPVREREVRPSVPTATKVVAADDFEAWDPWEEDVAWDTHARYQAAAADPNAWDAVPTTLPTYVSAPRATAVPREIDRASGGDWSGDAMVQAARRMRRPRITSEDLTDERYGVNWKVEDAATAELPAVNVRVVNE